jgi:light-regulated signal transduction histidine kinase (bacteriophytochrome)/CheY-like chemotaxis protein
VSDTDFHVDLTNCDREPIHILGAIQPFGFLLALSNDWLVARASANVADFIGQAPDALIGQPLVQIFTSDAVHAIRNRLSLLRGEDGVERLLDRDLRGDGRRYDLALHFSGGQVVIEAEPAQDDAGDAAGTVRGMISRLDSSGTMETFFREGARQVRALTGFDRVMVYRFDESGAGEVVGEAVRPGFGSFLGLHYPASDIPAQARILYVRNLFRIIANVGATPVPIVPARNERGAPLDLSLSVLRAVSPIHIEYLTNMGVAASLSISIVIDGKLWGLFACHHYTPRLPALERRALAELFGQMFAMKLESRERQIAAEYAANGRMVADRLLASVAGDSSLLDDPAWLGEMLDDAIAADGVGVYINGRVALSGLTPTEDQFRAIVGALNGTAAGRVYATDRIADILPSAADHATVSAGLLALPISRRPRDYVVLFRQELLQSVRWGGDPHKPAEFGPNGPRLTPRKSFETWSELVRSRSTPFTPAEVRVAETLRATLIEVVLRLSDEAHVERQLAAERQELLIAELNHRVRNILSLIRGVVRQSRGSAASLDDYVRELDGRIHALARAHNQITSDSWGPAPLRGLIETEAAAYLAARSDRVRTEGPDVLLDPLAFATVALVFHELVTNSAKYGGLSDSGRVSVSWRLNEAGDLLIDWCENGGPAVQAPTRQGFGSTIIRRSIPYDLGGSARIDYKLAGVEAHFCVPARHVTQRRGPQPAIPDPHAAIGDERLPDSSQPLAGQIVLLVEDSLIIAMDAEDVLGQLGAERVVAAASVRQALEAIDASLPTLALLDINLGDETSFPIAERLLQRGIPFAFATGYGDQAALPPAFGSIPVLQKPYTIAGVSRELSALL